MSVRMTMRTTNRVLEALRALESVFVNPSCALLN
jgi:hypothetical protein